MSIHRCSHVLARLVLAGVATLSAVLPSSPAAVPAAPRPAAAWAAARDDAVPAGGTPDHDLLDDAVGSSGAADEQLDVAAALDRGARLFSLQATYHDWGAGQADYYLAGPAGVSHQPLRALFGPLGAWLAAPDHDQQTVLLAVSTDSASANPAQFRAACQAFTDNLGRYLLKPSDLPPGKTLWQLAPDELAALQGQPRVVTDWADCTGEPLPLDQPPPVVTGASHDHWMADLGETIGQRPLRQVVIPGSHDAATYGKFSNAFYQMYAQTQDQDITGQLNSGSRYFDLRFEYHDWGDGGDYYNYHGVAVSQTVVMADVLDQVSRWIDDPAHKQEIVMLQISFGDSKNEDLLSYICETSFKPDVAAGHVLQPSMVPAGTTLYDMSMDEIWALPGGPRIITTWSDCTGEAWPPAPAGDAPTPFGGPYADDCYSARQIADKLIRFLDTRQDVYHRPVDGLFDMGLMGTPEADTCLYLHDPRYMAPWQGDVLRTVTDWWQQDQWHARKNLNIIAGDFFGESFGGGEWPFPQVAMDMNNGAQAPHLTLATNPQQAVPVIITCDDPRASGPVLTIYPAPEGPDSAHRKTFASAAGAASVRAGLNTGDFPDATVALRAECVDGAAMTSRIIVPASDFPDADPQLTISDLAGGGQKVHCHDWKANGFSINAYPESDGPNSPHRVFTNVPAGTLDFDVYLRRDEFPAGNYGLRIDCTNQAGLTDAGTEPVSALGSVLSLRLALKDDNEVFCDRHATVLTSLLTLAIYPTTEGPDSPHRRSASSSNGEQNSVELLVHRTDFPPGNYQLTATCASSDTPPYTATPVTFPTSDIPVTDVVSLESEVHNYNRVICSRDQTLGLTSLLTLTIYPTTEGPDGPHRRSVTSPNGQQDYVLMLVYRADFPPGDYQLTATCATTDAPPYTAQPVTFSTGDIRPAVILLDPAQAPPGWSVLFQVTGAGYRPREDVQVTFDDTVVRTVSADESGVLSMSLVVPSLTPGPYIIEAKGQTSGVRVYAPFAITGGTPTPTPTATATPTPPATPTPTPTPTRPAGGVTAQITGCSVQGGGGGYACALQVRLGAPLPVDTVLSVDIGGATFANPSGGARPEVTSAEGCAVPPIPSPYLADGAGRYTRYSVNISSGGCAAGAVVTFGEAVAGAAHATITQTVMVPGFDAATATFQLPPEVVAPPAPAGDDLVTLHHDARVGSYRQRQAIRDAYHGQIDEATFNEGLNAGKRLEAALADATAAKHGGD
jgi:hypothetical protein